MPYQVEDAGASIRITGDEGVQLIGKRSIQRIAIVSGDMIQISRGDPLNSIFFHYGEVYAPQLDSVQSLCDFINGLIT